MTKWTSRFDIQTIEKNEFTNSSYKYFNIAVTSKSFDKAELIAQDFIDYIQQALELKISIGDVESDRFEYRGKYEANAMIYISCEFGEAQDVEKEIKRIYKEAKKLF
jgi:hypothetical protein